MDMNANSGCGVAHQQDEVEVAVEVKRARPFIVFSRG